MSKSNRSITSTTSSLFELKSLNLNLENDLKKQIKTNEILQKERNSACLELNEFKIQHDVQIKQLNMDYKVIEMKLQNEIDEKEYFKNTNNQLKEEIYFHQVLILKKL